MKGIMKKFLSLSGFGVLAMLSCQAQASGYKMEFQSPSVLADGGDAAVVEDAGTNWYNSSGLVYLPQQLTVSAVDVYAPTSFSGNVTAPSVFGPAFSFAASGSASSHPNNILPAIHYTIPFYNRWAFGMSVVPAWGFTEDYGQSSLVRYDITRVYTKTLDIAPSLAFKVNEQWSIGAGPDFHYFSVLSRNNVLTEGPALFGGTTGDSIARFSANRWGYGAHAGVLYRLNEATRIGLNYRSKIVMDLEGYSDFALNGGPLFETNQFTLKVPLPPTTSLSFYHDINPAWALMGTIAYDQWSVLHQYTAHNIAQPPSPAVPTGIVPTLVQQQNMQNTFDLAFGAHYRLNEQWLFRGSLKYEPTPTVSQFRDLNFPDGNKLGINIGTRYQMSKQLALDLIYGHVFVKTMHINGVNPLTLSTASGHSSSTIDLLGGQLVWTI